MEGVEKYPMMAFIRALLGTYQAITYQVHSVLENPDGSYATFTESIIPAGAAGVDWGYVIAGAAFLIVLYCTLKLLGALICKIF